MEDTRAKRAAERIADLDYGSGMAKVRTRKDKVAMAERIIADEYTGLHEGHDKLQSMLAKATKQRDAALEHAEEFVNAARELQRFGAPGSRGCWCSSYPKTASHSPGCQAMAGALARTTDDTKGEG